MGKHGFAEKLHVKLKMLLMRLELFQISPLSIAVQRLIGPHLFTTMLAVPIISTEGEPPTLFIFS
jgi:hypothetical protein